MVTLQRIGEDYNSPYLEIVGLSTDEKPTNKINDIPILNGSVFKEIDTGSSYNYDAQSKKWLIDIIVGSDGESSGVLTQVQNQLIDIKQDLSKLQDIKENAITTVMLNGQPVSSTNNVLNLPLASGDVIGLVKGTDPHAADSVNKVAINDDGTMEVISLSVTKLNQDEDNTIVLDCSDSLF